MCVCVKVTHQYTSRDIVIIKLSDVLQLFILCKKATLHVLKERMELVRWNFILVFAGK